MKSWKYKIELLVKDRLRVFVRRDLRKKITAWHDAQDVNKIDSEIKDLVEFTRKNGIYYFPYPFSKKIAKEWTKIKVFGDDVSGLSYVMFDNKRLYQMRHSDNVHIQHFHSLTLLEQDNLSPHKYLSDTFTFDEGDILFDIGAAQGNFSLSVIEKAKHVYLFECEDCWMESLQKTFEPWKEKVTIINKYAGNEDTDTTATIDSITQSLKGETIFLKIDVEGAEQTVLTGAYATLTNGNNRLKAAICTYHRQTDYETLSAFMNELGYNCETSKGYMLFPIDKQLAPPFFRRGLIRCAK
jgi:hypothetical protein